MSLYDHLVILPILLPLFSAILLLLPPLRSSIERQRGGSLISLALLALLAIALVIQADQGRIVTYALGDWAAPFGILLVLDRLSAMMVLLTTVLGLLTTVYACAGDDRQGSFYHALIQFQLMGINGAFLTGDLFNLFVFFEVLLIASYALLIHGGGKWKTRAGLHYVILNLTGSSLFLFALGILYGTLGTLNMADMARVLAQLPASEQPLAEAGGLLLLVVFALKAAAFPLYFWLPSTYSAASAPVAALFAIMSKVGIYAILRVHGLFFGDNAGALAGLATPWLWLLTVATLTVGAIGVLTSPGLRTQVAYLVIVSVGTLLGGLALGTPRATGASLYYLVHTTLITGGLFLLADLISRQRGQAGDRIVAARPMPQSGPLSLLFMLGAIGVIGLPPLSGFIGKVWLLQAADSPAARAWLWPLLLGSSLLLIVALSRTGSTLFWRVSGTPLKVNPASSAQLAATLLLLAAGPLLALTAAPLAGYMEATAAQLHQPELMLRSVLPESQTALSHAMTGEMP